MSSFGRQGLGNLGVKDFSTFMFGNFMSSYWVCYTPLLLAQLFIVFYWIDENEAYD